MASLRVIGFASGSPLSQAVMRRIAQDHTLVGIVLPPRPDGMVSSIRGTLARLRNPLRRLGAPFLHMHDIVRLQPDLIVVASFPRLIPAAILDSARIGAFNIHMSLLPRHRGVDPIFWTYWHDDRDAGVTTHWMTGKLDAGDIAAQQSVSLPRGLPSRALYLQLATIATRQLADVLDLASKGKAPRQSQKVSNATYGSLDDIRKARIPFAQWPAERVWHVISGLGDQRSGLVDSAPGRRLEHGRAVAYRNTAEIEPGRVDTLSSGYELHCRDGIVVVQPRRPP